MSDSVKVLVVDDSAFVRSIIAKKLKADPGIEVAGFARDGVEALAKIKELQPTVVTLDITMPEMDGLTTLKHIMADHPLPVIMVSALTGPQTQATIHALELGAVDFFLKPSLANPAGADGSSNELIDKIKAAASIPRGRLGQSSRGRHAGRQVRRPVKTPEKTPGGAGEGAQPAGMSNVLVIGSSTGGPKALTNLLPELPPDLPTGILIVQHMPPGFTQSLSQRLNQLCPYEVKEAEEGDKVKPGQALLAPGGYHMTIDSEGVIKLDKNPPVCGVRPSVDVTMESVVRVYGKRTLGVVLTGMGQDGTIGAAMIKAANGSVAVEHESTCAVYGMPRSIVEDGTADHVVPLNKMANTIIGMCR